MRVDLMKVEMNLGEVEGWGLNADWMKVEGVGW